MANVFIDENTMKAIADSIRDKTGSTELLLPADMAAAIAEITGGGGDSDIINYVLFMDEYGTKELYSKPTIDGDDCVNVVSKGLLAKPTKASTEQYNYTYSGWSMTPGGAADANALVNITEDRILYASFTSAVRSYTITYKDSDGTALKTESLPYGATPYYIPEKDGYSFDGWEPEITIVTGDAEYYAQWGEPQEYLLANYTWDQIVEFAESGQASKFNIGDTTTITLWDKDITVRLIGTNFDDLADGTGKAGMTFEVLGYPCNATGMNGAGFMCYSGSSYNTWTYLNTEFYKTANGFTDSGSPAKQLKNILGDHLKNVKKKLYNFNTSTIETFNAYAWLRSLSEFGFISNHDEGETYPIYTSNKPIAVSEECIYYDYGGATAVNHWTRSKFASGETQWYRINTTGSPEVVKGTKSSYGVFCFCI